MQNTENTQNTEALSLANAGIGGLMRKYSLPCIISLLVGALYNIVDQIFIANADYLGSYGNAANTVVFPLTVIALGIAVMIGDGCCAFVSITLGSGNEGRAKQSVGNAITVSIIGGCAVTAAYIIFAESLLRMFGGNVNAETMSLSREYLWWLIPGIPFYMFGQAMNPIIRADGSPRFAMMSTLAGAVANIILDPIFIFGLKWGMMGAALATIIGQILTAILSAVYLCRAKLVRPRPNDLVPNIRLIGKTLSLGICSFLAQFSLVAAMAAINNMILKYGALDPIFGAPEYAQIPMAVVGIVMKFFQIVISIVIGMAAGCIPIVGFNMGAGKRHRVRGLLTRLLICEACIGAIAMIIAECFPHTLIKIFGAANESVHYTNFAIRSFRIYLCMLILACINKATFIFLQAMGRAVESTLLSMVRELIFGVGLALLLPRFWGLDGVLCSMPAADILTAVISLVIIIKTYKDLGKKTELLK